MYVLGARKIKILGISFSVDLEVMRTSWTKAIMGNLTIRIGKPELRLRSDRTIGLHRTNKKS